MNISIIVPVYNEEKTILEILNRIQILNKFCKTEIIVVNDGSTDKSKEIIDKNKSLYSKIISFKKNLGKGKAVIEGLKNCNSDYVLVQDSDLEYHPRDILRFIDKIKNENADLLVGSRFIGPERSVLHFWHMIGNKFITFLFNLLNNTAFSDIYCCYCLFKKQNIDVGNLKSFGWGQQAEILTYLVNKSSKIFELSVSYNARTYKAGKKIKYFNVIEVVYWIVYIRLKLFFIK